MEINELKLLIGKLQEKLDNDKKDTDNRLSAQDKQIEGIVASLEPITDNLRAGKLLYVITIKVLAFLAALGSVYIFIKQIMRDSV